jgi:aspartate-semialdehyde dehydrogenase
VFVGHSEPSTSNSKTRSRRKSARHPAHGAGLPRHRQAGAGGYVTPYEAAGEDATYISRIREDATVENGLCCGACPDNLRKGAALNAIQIAECLINRKLLSAKKKAAYG